MKKTGILAMLLILWGLAGISAAAAGSRDFLLLRPIGQFTGLYEIHPASASGFSLDVSTCSDGTDNRRLQLYQTADINQQKFSFSAVDRGVCQIRACHSGSRLCTVSEGAGEGQSISMVSFTDPGVGNLCGGVLAATGWVVEYAGDGAWYIRARYGGYLTAEAAFNGASVTLQSFSGGENQKWRLEETSRSQTDTMETDLPNPYEEGGSLAQRVLLLDLGDGQERLSADTLAGWLLRTAEHTLSPDSEVISAYAASLAGTYDTVGEPRTFLTSYGREITLKMGNYGWELDQASLTETLKSLLLAEWESDTVTVTVPWLRKGAVLGETSDIGDTYVEIDLSGQKVWLYKDGARLLYTDCVSGTRGTDNETPGGVYAVYGKQSPTVLVGPGYRSPVDFWMPFNGGIGLHDATWRSEFGGDIYLTNGSHGCINLPYEAAQLIYETISIGDPVVCYYYEYRKEE